ncbi:MAG TPA: hypothetical protein VMV81_02750, partial [Phycisphaerae bacterium]|nr:hypothetical protein [Phycisphaerae bacterium]
MKVRRPWLDYLVYLAVRCLAAVLNIFPIEANLRMMRSLGAVWFTLPHALPETRVPGFLARQAWLRWLVKLSAASNKLLNRFREHRNRAEGHIRMAFPEMSPAQVSATAKRSMQQIAMLAIEVLFGPKQITQWGWARHVKLGKLDEALRILLGRRGCIMLTGHYGNWELLGYSLAVLGFDIVAVMRP